MSRAPMSRRRFGRGLAGGMAAWGLGVGALGAAGAGCRREAEQRTELWFTYGGKNRETLLELVTRFNREQGGNVHPTYQGDYFEGLAKLRTAIYADAAPAVTHVIGEVVPYLAEAGALLPFEDPDALGLVPALSQAGCFSGAADRPVVALPFNRSTPIAYLNGAVLDELGLEPPRTWDELEQFAERAKIESGGEVTRWGFECPIDWWFWIALVGQAGGSVIEDDGTVSLGGDAGVRALRFWQRLVHERRVMRPPPGRDYNAWQVTNNDFLAGRAAMIWTSTAFLRYLEENASFPVIAAPLPKDKRFAVPTGGTMFVLPKAGPEGQRAMARAFSRWMMSPSPAVEFATKTGYMPVSREGVTQLETEGFYEKSPNDRVAFDQLDVAFPWPWSTELFRVQREIVQPRLEAAVLLEQDAARVLGEAREAASR